MVLSHYIHTKLVRRTALALAVSARWQRGVFWGVPYIPVYLEYLGVALIAIALLAAIFCALARAQWAVATLAVVFATALVATTAVTNALNERVIKAFDGVKRAMTFNEHALAAGLLALLLLEARLAHRRSG